MPFAGALSQRGTGAESRAEMTPRLGHNAALAGMQAVATALILFVTYSFLVRALSTEQFGLWALIASISAVARIGDFGFSTSLSRFVAADLSVDSRAAAASLAQSVTVAVAILASALAAALYFPAQGLLAKLVPPDLLEPANRLLPYTLASLVLMVVGLTLLGALEGCQRFGQRALLMITGSLTLLAAAVALVPRHGVVGIGMAQLMQGTVLILLGWLLVRRNLGIGALMPIRLRLADLRRVWRFGLGVQAISITQLAVEPLAKILMTRFGGLEATGLFELAYRVTTQLRAPLVAAGQVILPAVASLPAADRSAAGALYRRAYERLFPASVTAFSLLLLGWPLVSWLLLGKVDALLVAMGWLLTLAWFVNTLSAPAYFTLLGQGNARWNLYGHLLTAALTGVLGYVLGTAFGALGVSTGYAIAIAAGSAVAWVFCRARLGTEVTALLPERDDVKLDPGMSPLRRFFWHLAWPVRAYVRWFPVSRGKGWLLRGLLLPVLGQKCEFDALLPPAGRVRLRGRETIGWHWMVYGPFEQAERDFATHAVANGGWAIDVGANVGVFTVAVAQALAPDAHLLAFEPLPGNVSRLRQNLEASNLGRVEILPMATGATAGEAEFLATSDAAYAGLVNSLEAGRTGDVLRVPVTTVDDEWRARGEPKVTLVKLDIEGGELSALQGSTALLNRWHPLLLVEATSIAQRDAIAGFLEDYGYRCEQPAGFEPWNFVFRAAAAGP